MNTYVEIMFKGTLLQKTEMSLEDLNRFIAFLSYGGYSYGSKKLIVSDYVATELDPLKVTINLQTEEEANFKALSELSESFVNKLIPPLQRKNKSELN